MSDTIVTRLIERYKELGGTKEIRQNASITEIQQLLAELDGYEGSFPANPRVSEIIDISNSVIPSNQTVTEPVEG